jgi:phosphatidylserine/phosphatidylglycerophosphate/cardiolipin synthase-like enzyme
MTTSLAELDQFLGQPLPDDYPADQRQLYAPTDQVHEALLHLVQSATASLVIAMYGFTDRELADAVRAKMADPKVFVQLTLDASQAVGHTESELLNAEQFPASNVAVGHSEHGALMHLKEVIIDGHTLITGSTNWSESGENKQDNALVVIGNPHMCARSRARIDAVHAHMVAASRARR